MQVAGIKRALPESDATRKVIAADVYYAAAHDYDPANAQFADFAPFREFVSGPLKAGHQFFGQVDIDAETEDMASALKDLSGATIYEVAPEPTIKGF